MWVYIKNIVLNFSLWKAGFFFAFLFSIYKNVDSMDVCKSSNINMGIVMKNPEMLKFIPDHLKTKKCISIQLKNYHIY